jgi:hypothetical protein
MKSLRKTLNGLFFASLAGLSACVEYASAPCDMGQLVDVAGFEEARWMNFYDSKEHAVYPIEDTERVKMGQGLYGDGESVLLRTCRIGKGLYAETSTDHGSFELARLDALGHKIAMNTVFLSQQQLSDMGISFHFESRQQQTPLVLRKLFSEASKNIVSSLQGLSSSSSVLVIDAIPADKVSLFESALLEGPVLVQMHAKP